MAEFSLQILRVAGGPPWPDSSLKESSRFLEILKTFLCQVCLSLVEFSLQEIFKPAGGPAWPDKSFFDWYSLKEFLKILLGQTSPLAKLSFQESLKIAGDP